MAKYTLSDIDTRMADYKNKFRELKTALVDGVAVQTGITVVRMMNVLKDTGRSGVLRLRSVVHRPDATTGQCVAGPFQGHTFSVSSVAYSPDRTHIVSGSDDCSVKVWKVQDLVSFGDLCEKNSWIQSSDGTCFGWMAPWNSNSFHLPIQCLVISSDRNYQVDIDYSLFGDSWTSCWS